MIRVEGGGHFVTPFFFFFLSNTEDILAWQFCENAK